MALHEYWVEVEGQGVIATYAENERALAQAHAEEVKGCLLYATYEFTDSELDCDFRENPS